MIALRRVLDFLLLPLLTISPLVSASRCYYGRAVMLNEVSERGLWGYAERACYTLGGAYGPATSSFSPSVKRVCYNVNQGNRISFEITNDAQSNQKLDFATCYHALKALLDECDHGGEQTQQGFTYVHEPNVGACS